jgi:hypothetical protein
MQRRQSRQKLKARVGIFWFYEGKLITDSTPLSHAEPYGDALTHPTSHIDYWTRLQQQRSVPLDCEYDEVPRGRVNYDAKSKRFLFMADRCIIADRRAVQQIVVTFSLPRDSKPVTDAHYRCPRCLVKGL